MQHANTIGYELQTARKTVIDNVLGLACKYLYTLCAYPPFKNITISRHCQSKSRCKHVVCSFPSIANMDKKQLKIILSISPSSLLLGWVFFLLSKFPLLSLLSLSLLFEQQSHYCVPWSVFLRVPTDRYVQISPDCGFFGVYRQIWI